MPNHITNLMTVLGPEEDVAAFEKKHIVPEPEKPTELCFDLETIIPMPQCIKDTIRNCFTADAADQCGDAEVEYYAKAALAGPRARVPKHERMPWFPEGVDTWGDLKRLYEETRPAAAKYGKRALIAAAETGFPGWYEWSVANWGTKWNSYGYSRRERGVGMFMFAFETAWSPPKPVFDELTKMWPTLTFVVEAIDEGGPASGKWRAGCGHLQRVDEDRDPRVRQCRALGRDSQ